MVGVWRLEPQWSPGAKPRWSVWGGAPPEGDDSAIKTNVQFLALAYINIQIAAYSCKAFFRADCAEIAQL